MVKTKKAAAQVSSGFWESRVCLFRFTLYFMSCHVTSRYFMGQGEVTAMRQVMRAARQEGFAGGLSRWR